MKYRDRTTGQVYTLFELQQKFSNVSFPANWDTTTFDFANVDIVQEVPRPVESDMRNRIDFNGIQLIDGIWTETWVEVPKYDNPTEQASWEATCLETEWDAVRTRRNILLTQTDYTQMPDTPITVSSKAAFKVYRQALRDITTQTSPYNIIWPDTPNYEKE